MEPIAATTNPFGGIIPKPEALDPDPAAFAERLRVSLTAWKDEGYRVVWLEVSIAKAALVPVAVEAGFTFHHSGDGYLMMTLQLEEGAYVPAYASHYIGAGGVVLNEARELLVVSEKYHRRAPGPPRYKLPGGAFARWESTWPKLWCAKSPKKPESRLSSTHWSAFATGTATASASRIFTSSAACAH